MTDVTPVIKDSSIYRTASIAPKKVYYRYLDSGNKSFSKNYLERLGYFAEMQNYRLCHTCQEKYSHPHWKVKNYPKSDFCQILT